jgi:hypothetical protein
MSAKLWGGAWIFWRKILGIIRPLIPVKVVMTGLGSPRSLTNCFTRSSCNHYSMLSFPDPEMGLIIPFPNLQSSMYKRWEPNLLQSIPKNMC